MNDSGGRWWEIRLADQPNADAGSDRDLITDTRGRSRLERSLSTGTEPVGEPHHPARVARWVIGSVVAVAALVLVVGYALPKDRSSYATSPVAVAPGGAAGDLVVIASGNKPVWATGTEGNRNATLELQDDGNVVVYAQGHRAVWSTGIP